MSIWNSRLKPGKKTLVWEKASKRLKNLYFKKDITICEARLDNCWGGKGLTFAHRFKRSDPRCRHIFKQTILCCLSCHIQIEKDKTLTEMLFKDLRGI